MVGGDGVKLALAVALLGSAACIGPGGGPGMVEQARGQFSRSAFCPDSRVQSQHVLPIPVPPPAIASDPERLAMWRGTYEREAEQDARQLVAVTGCGERTTYACWAFSGWEQSNRKRERVTIGWSCIALGPPGQDVSMRSTTEGPQPNTTASSR